MISDSVRVRSCLVPIVEASRTGSDIVSRSGIWPVSAAFNVQTVPSRNVNRLFGKSAQWKSADGVASACETAK